MEIGIDTVIAQAILNFNTFFGRRSISQLELDTYCDGLRKRGLFVRYANLDRDKLDCYFD